MDIERESSREAFEAIPRNARVLRGAKFKDGEYVALSLFDESSKELAAQLNYGWEVWLSAKAQAVPNGFVVVNQKDLLELTIAINAVDLATHTESKTNEVREMWQQVALKLMALGTAQEPAND